MIFSSRIEISATLRLQSDLHIGTAEKCDAPEAGELREYSGTLRAFDKAPMIPSSTIKGVVRAALGRDNDLVKELLGTGTDHPIHSGSAARLWFDHAFLSKEVSGNELAELTGTPATDGTFRAKHVALDPESGAAADNKLFDREMVGEGTEFAFSATWFGMENTKDELKKQVLPALAVLCEGLEIGSGTQKGHGRIALEPTTLTFTKYSPSKSGKLEPNNLSIGSVVDAIKAIETTRKKSRQIRLRLTCLGPFLSVRTTDENRLLPLRRNDMPFLQEESVIGAFRSRAGWIAAVDQAPDINDSIDNPDLKRSRTQLSDANLTSVERLFGVSGRKAKLKLKKISCSAPGQRIQVTSNSIDRLTGATRSGALFQRDAYWQPSFDVEMEVEGEHPLLDTVIASFDGTPLELGHGSSIGFGWFDVEVLQ